MVGVDMDQLRSREILQHWTDDWHRRGKIIGFLPTMGALHAGHLALVAAAQQRTDRVLVSIFVNPTQFGPNEDFERYPRVLDADQELLAAVGCDGLFLPSVTDIFPSGCQSSVRVEPLGRTLCGQVRENHFQGVATVVTILLNLVGRCQAFFGTKDYLQWILIRRMVRDLALPTEVVGVPTVREADGLALSSRNRYLDPSQRQQAVALSQAVIAAREAYRRGEHQARRLEAIGRQVLVAAGITDIDYVVVRDAETLAIIETGSTASGAVMLIAARVGSTRLIDNGILS